MAQTRLKSGRRLRAPSVNASGVLLRRAHALLQFAGAAPRAGRPAAMIDCGSLADLAGDTVLQPDGKATVDFGVAAFGNAVALLPNGRIVVAGQRTGGDD